MKSYSHHRCVQGDNNSQNCLFARILVQLRICIEFYFDDPPMERTISRIFTISANTKLIERQTQFSLFFSLSNFISVATQKQKAKPASRRNICACRCRMSRCDVYSDEKKPEERDIEREREREREKTMKTKRRKKRGRKNE